MPTTPHIPILSPGLRVAAVHGVQHVVVRRRAGDLSSRHPRTVHRPLLHEEEGTSSKTTHNARWISWKVTKHNYLCHKSGETLWKGCVRHVSLYI